MATQTIDATIFASSHPDIVKRTSLSGVIFSGLILLVGVLAFVSTFEMEDRSSTLSMGLMVIGSVCSGNQKRLFIYLLVVLQKNKVYFLI